MCRVACKGGILLGVIVTEFVVGTMFVLGTLLPDTFAAVTLALTIGTFGGK